MSKPTSLQAHSTEPSGSFLTQRELAERWRCSIETLKRRRRAAAWLGSDVLFIPIARGTKGPPRGHTWKHLTRADLQSDDYIRSLQEAAAVAAVLGPVSGDLVAVDFDTDQAAQDFFMLNPALQTTLRTRGKRGSVIWLRMTGEYPVCCKRFTDSSKSHLGEWRGGGTHYSIIAGEHMDGGCYSVPVEAPPAPVPFSSIRRPLDWLNIPVAVEEKGSSRKENKKAHDAMQSGSHKNLASACPSAWHPQSLKPASGEPVPLPRASLRNFL